MVFLTNENFRETKYTDNDQSVIITGLVRVILGYPPGKRVPSYSQTEVWTTVHAGMSIVCASLPIFKPLINQISRSHFTLMLSNLLFSRRSSGSIQSHPEGGVRASGSNEAMQNGSNAN